MNPNKYEKTKNRKNEYDIHWNKTKEKEKEQEAS